MGMWHFVASFRNLFQVSGNGVVFQQITQLGKILQRQIFSSELRVDRQGVKVGIGNQFF